MFALNSLTVSKMSNNDFNSFDVSDGFTENRSLETYIECNHPDLEESLNSLQPNQVWVDIGCGQGVAQQDYVRKYQNGAHTIGITLLKPLQNPRCLIEADKENKRHDLYLANFLTFPMESLYSRVSLITDVVAVFQYSGQLSRSLEKIYQLLECGGKAFISFSLAKSYFNKVTIINSSKTQNEHNPDVVLIWLKTIKGFHVSEKTIDIQEKISSVVLEKKSEPFHADPFYIQENLFTSDNRTWSHRIFDCFRGAGLDALRVQNKWTPPGDDYSYGYNFFWEISKKNRAKFDKEISDFPYTGKHL